MLQEVDTGTWAQWLKDYGTLITMGTTILTGAISTLVVSVLISRSNEKHKAELAQDTHRFQTIHPKRVAAVEEMSLLVEQISSGFRTIDIYIEFAGMNPDALLAINESLEKVMPLMTELSDSYLKAKIVLDEETAKDLDEFKYHASRAWLQLNTYVKDENRPPLESTDDKEWVETKELLNKVLPADRKLLDKRFRSILAPATTREGLLVRIFGKK